jgi:two-component system CheB/CheR fusion protein
MPTRKKESKQKPIQEATTNKTAAKSKPARKVSRLGPKVKNNFYIVGMGASAGGLEDFEKFFKNMPADSGVAFVLVPHLDPSHVSLMPDLIQKTTTMEVLQIKDRMKVKSNTVYITPPNVNIAIFHGALNLIEPAGGRGLKLPIDRFLRSLAQDQGEKAVCVILSGMGSDGTLGLKEIKSKLGLVIVQDPVSAKYDSMPVSAIQTGLADYILPPQKMPEQIVKYTAHATANSKQRKIVPGTKGDLPDALNKIFIMLRSQTGHDFSFYKPSTICRRIERRMNVHHLDQMDAYVRYLQHNTDEVNNLFRELLIGVTSFFRDPDAFEVLRHKIMPPYLEKKANGDLLRPLDISPSTKTS